MLRNSIILSSLFVANMLIGQGTNITWADDIACLVFSHCSNCHNDNGVAPFSLITYEDVANRKALIYHEVVVEKNMPPWLAKSPENAFVGDHSLTAGEIEIFKEWLDNDIPVGDLSNAPDVPNFDGAIELTTPDYVIETEPYTVPETNGSDIYRCYVFPVDFDQDMFIESIEFIPGNKNAVHHILLYHDEGNTATNLDNADPDYGYTCFGGIGTNSADLLGGWAPGGSATRYPEGMGVRIPKNTNLVVQVHYPFYSEGETDASTIHINLTESAERELTIQPLLNHFSSITNGPLFIPANEIRTFNQSVRVDVPFDVVMTGIAPHAHLICTSLRSWLVAPDGTEKLLIDLPKWDFEWQKFYEFKRPVVVPAGSFIRSEGTYDNTVNNPNNPSVPPQNVSVGEATNDEMMVFFYTLGIYQNGDENAVYDDTEHHPHSDNCTTAVTSVENEEQFLVSVYPNPAKNYVLFDTKQNISTIKLFDITGRIVAEKTGSFLSSLNVADLPQGIYVVQLNTEDKMISKSIVID